MNASEPGDGDGTVVVKAFEVGILFVVVEPGDGFMDVKPWDCDGVVKKLGNGAWGFGVSARHVNITNQTYFYFAW